MNHSIKQMKEAFVEGFKNSFRVLRDIFTKVPGAVFQALMDSTDVKRTKESRNRVTAGN